MLEYEITATRIDAHGSVVHNKDAKLIIDTDLKDRTDALNPAKLLLITVAACILKNMEHIAAMFQFAYTGLTLLRTLLLLTLMILSGALVAGPWHAAEQNTSGWHYMTPDERIEHQRRMRSFATYEECKTYQTEHRAQMAARAQQQGIKLHPRPNSGCEQLRRRGKFQ